MAWDPAFERAFNPQAIAVVGVSRSGPEAVRSAPAGGAGFVAALKDIGFPGRIYPINPNAEELQGLRCYPNLVSLPEPVDLVMISVDRSLLPAVLEDCIAANAKNLHVFTAGFEETGTEEGIRLGNVVREIAQRGGLRMLGPNCMGVVYVPKARVAVSPGRSPVSGNVAFVSQSGVLAQSYSSYGPSVGIQFSKVLSIGNSYVINATDVLEYLATDPDTDIICMYVEGVSDGRRLLDLVRETNPRKPVIIWKGGLTEQGSRAVASHTASLTGQKAVWNAFFRQTGAIGVGSVEEMADVTSILLVHNKLPGRRAVLLVGGGGNSVASADECSQAGLDTPPLGPETREALSRLVPEAGSSVRNPIDAIMLANTVQGVDQGLRAVFADPVTDVVVLLLQVQDRFVPGRAPTTMNLVDWLCNSTKDETRGKPVVAIINSLVPDPRSVEHLDTIRSRLIAAKVPVFPTLPRAARALSLCISYYEHQAELVGEPLATVGDS